MAWAVEDDRRDVAHPPAERLGDRLDVLGDGPLEVDLPAGRGTDGHLPHVHVGKRLQRPRIACRDHCHRAAPASRDDPRALQRVEREVERLAAGADLLPRREIVRLLLRGPDDDVPVDRQLLQRLLHAGARGVLSPGLVCAPEPARTRQRRALGDAREALAEAGAGRARLNLGGVGSGLRHETFCSLSAAVSTSSMTAAIDVSRWWLSITGTS